ncbi:precorrin-6A reductase [Clostridium cylindrosporum]|uniref:precorrin-2 dehydrogenase n=1 Tax=Clostridium cylindrosporum DSM 605 TaxID=1121307 RepID=A0A0J8DC50_CLOCY|nr:precorrin-6A reductase [Clostridium cylindrosporum]KMT21838.1 cobalt-precorrin-6A reductase CbiJ [Clostridium cylindrosporum DSM 605]
MYKILIFGGTTEGRILTERLSRYNIDITVSVATETGRDVLPKGDNIKCLVNRLTREEMAKLIGSGFNLVIDATHPYASEVTENILAASKESNVEYIRLLRKEEKVASCIYVKSIDEAIDYLNTVDGNILLTTGSRDLHEFIKVNNYETRVFARVLPTVDVMEKCYSIGLKAKNIIAMQGPFTLELNSAILAQINAKYMVTKESGDVGGFQEKVDAALKSMAQLIVIGRPLKEIGYSLEEIEQRILSHLKLDYKKEDIKRYFPLFVDLEDKLVKVFGGGNIALRRIKTLLNFNCKVEVIAPKVLDEIKTLEIEGKIKLTLETYNEGDCKGSDIVLALTDNREVNHRIYSECTELNILCNIGDKKEECSFYFPGVVIKDNVVVGVTASGLNHSEAKKVTRIVRDIFN